jgi:hypothetical protein
MPTLANIRDANVSKHIPIRTKILANQIRKTKNKYFRKTEIKQINKTYPQFSSWTLLGNPGFRGTKLDGDTTVCPFDGPRWPPKKPWKNFSKKKTSKSMRRIADLQTEYMPAFGMPTFPRLTAQTLASKIGKPQNKIFRKRRK